ncbi:VENN motif pre-toxin domain-containing protein [Proteus mirabilis]|nr:VENN motif pre-toxin domain-containing protein [Proteus mirabilis]
MGKHTQLDGAVISSTAEAKNNQLDTGTLGFSDIHNYAEYKVEHQSGGVSTSGGVEGNMLANMGHALAMAGNHSDSAENTTQSAVSQGTWTVRDSDNQQQDIAQLSQDTDNAHSTLNKIFDKEKEQNRQQKQQLVGEIGAQVIDLATTVDTLRGTNIAKEESTLNRLSDTTYDDIYQALSETKDNVTERDIQNYLFQQRLQDYTNQSDFGTGGKYTRAIQAITAFTQGMMGNSIVTAIANGSAPYLAHEVKNQIQGNRVESDIQRTIAHGLLNAGLALAKGENALVQAAGAMTGETVDILSHSLYGKTPEELTEAEKQNISAWATLASGIAGGLISDNSAGVANAAQAGKVVVENNYLSFDEARAFDKEMTICKAAGENCQPIIDKYAKIHGKNSEEFRKACQRNSLECTAGYERLKLNGGISAAERPTWLYGSLDNEDVRNAVLYINNQDIEFANKHSDNWDRFASFVGEPENVFGLYLGGRALFNSAASAEAKLIGTGLSMSANAGVQIYNGNTGDKFDYLSFGLAGFTGWTGTGRNLHSNVQLNAGSAYLGSKIAGENSEAAVVGAIFGTTLGYGLGFGVTNYWEKQLIKRHFGMPVSRYALKYAEIPFYSNYISQEFTLPPFPGIAGGALGSGFLEYSGAGMNSNITSDQIIEKNDISNKMTSDKVNQEDKR